MFTKEGWSTPYSIFLRLYEIECQKRNATTMEERRQSWRATESAFAKFMSSAQFGGVMLANGDVVSVDRAFLSRTIGVHPYRHAYFVLETGEVGKTDPTWGWRIPVEFGALLNACRTGLPGLALRASVLLILSLLCLAFLIAAIPFTLTTLHSLSPDLAKRFAAIIAPPLGALMEVVENNPHPSPSGWILGAMAALLSALLASIAAPPVVYDLMNARRARRACRAYAGRHLIIPDQRLEEFVRNHYPSPTADAPAGRPRHPAYDWYRERSFDRKALGLSMKELQAQMPKDANGNPPSETTIRDWEREHMQRKPPAGS